MIVRSILRSMVKGLRHLNQTTTTIRDSVQQQRCYTVAPTAQLFCCSGAIVFPPHPNRGLGNLVGFQRNQGRASAIGYTR